MVGGTTWLCRSMFISISFDARGLDHFRPLRSLFPDDRAELFGLVAYGLGAFAREDALHFGRLEYARGLFVEPRDHGARGLGGGEEAVPGAMIITGDARFGDGRNLGCGR